MLLGLLLKLKEEAICSSETPVDFKHPITQYSSDMKMLILAA
jgi:hypothetical protein